MAKETTFSQPPGRQVGLLAYDSANDRWQAVYVDASGNLKVDVVTSGLPSGAATAAKQDTMITALQLIDDLRNALNSVGADELDVNIESSVNLNGQLYVYDNGAWIPVATTDAGDGNPVVAIGRGANIAQMGNVGGDGVSTAIKVLFVGGLLYAFNGTSWDRLRCTNYALHTAVQSMPTTEVTAEGGDIFLNYEDVATGDISDENLAAGTNVLDAPAIPSGKVWVVLSAHTDYRGTTPTETRIAVYDGAATHILSVDVSPVSARPYPWTGMAILKAGENMRFIVIGATAGDDLYCRYRGYQMDAP